MRRKERHAPVADSRSAAAQPPRGRRAKQNSTHRIARARGITALSFAVVLMAALALHTGTGSLSAFGIGQIAVICPLGALETLVTGQVSSWHLFVGLAITVVLALVFGRAFCSWICPTPWVRRLFRRRGDDGLSDAPRQRVDVDAGAAEVGAAASSAAEGLEPVGGARDGLHVDSRHVVLFGVLFSSAIFGFPVFCLVCPVGLSIATLIAVWQLFQFNELTWGLLVFPLIVVLEVVVLHRWCRSICPIGALLSLISAGNKTFRPSVAAKSCLRAKGTACTVCVENCPEKLDPHSPRIPECTKCGRCIEHCSAHAITLPMIPKHGS